MPQGGTQLLFLVYQAAPSTVSVSSFHVSKKIQGIENEIRHMKTNLDELRRLQGQISTKAMERSTLFTLQQQQYAALSEENEGKVLTGTLVPNGFPQHDSS